MKESTNILILKKKKINNKGLVFLGLLLSLGYNINGDINEKDFAETIASGTVLVDFWASWCSYCKVTGAILEQCAVSAPAEAVIAKVNVDDNTGLAAKYHITTLPTLILFKDGVEISRHGVLKKAEILELLS